MQKRRGSSSSNNWFRLKPCGFGWTPCSIQGWITFIFYIAILVIIFSLTNVHSSTIDLIIKRVIAPFLLVTLVFIVLIINKGERIVWSLKGYEKRKK